MDISQKIQSLKTEISHNIDTPNTEDKIDSLQNQVKLLLDIVEGLATRPKSKKVYVNNF